MSNRVSFNNQMESIYKRAPKINQQPRKYYAFVEKVDNYTVDGKEMLFVRFDCIRLGDAPSIGRITPKTADEVLSGLPFIHIECNETLQKWQGSFFSEQLTVSGFEDSWIVIETKRRISEDEILANEFYNGAVQEPTYSISVVESYQNDTLALLEKTFDLKNIKSPASKTQIQTLLCKISGFDKVVVCDVGQGNLNFITYNGVPILYFDLGGGTGMHANTYVTTIKTCHTRNPSVLLSHWDTDHIETALRDSSNCSLDWIVPYQKVGRTHFNLATRIVSKGTLLIWPPSLTSFGFTLGEVVLCSGNGKNNSGLALFTYASSRHLLFSADCEYASITNLSNYKLDCLVSSHHGSSSGAVNVPNANGPQWLVHSFGAGNKWGHATTLSRNSHHAAGWVNVRETPGDSVSFDTANYMCPCGNLGCNLASTQFF